MAELKGSPAGDEGKSWRVKHGDVLADEITAINQRRAAHEGLEPVEPKAPQGGSIDAEAVIDAVGLTLSGGGIRSAAVCLGVLQGLNHHDLIKRIDYLSTVSGGGYMGSSLTTTMTRTGGFVFGGAPVDSGRKAAEIRDTLAMGHIRNYSNYLIPAGFRDVLTGVAIVVRGLVANVALTLPVILFLAALTIVSNPARSCLDVPNLFGVTVAAGAQPGFLTQYLPAHFPFFWLALALSVLPIAVSFFCSERYVTPVRYFAGVVLTMGAICEFASILPVEHFGLTLASVLLGLLLFFFWALARSRVGPHRLSEFRGHGPTLAATFLVLVAIIAFFEFQPFMIDSMFDAADGGRSTGLVTGVAVGWIKSLAAIAAPVAAVVTVFRQQVADLLKGNSVSSEIGAAVLAYGAKAAIWVAGAALPLLIWIGYLYLSYWGVANDLVAGQNAVCQLSPVQQTNVAKRGSDSSSDALTGKIQFDSQAKSFTAEISGSKTGAVTERTGPPPKPRSHVPSWLIMGPNKLAQLADRFFPAFVARWDGRITSWAMALLYISVAIVFFFFSWFLRPNANSLHRLYRDRLSKAFLFEPTPKRAEKVKRDDVSLDQGRDLGPLDDVKLSDLLYPGLRRVAAPSGRSGETTVASVRISKEELANRRNDLSNRLAGLNAKEPPGAAELKRKELRKELHDPVVQTDAPKFATLEEELQRLNAEQPANAVEQERLGVEEMLDDVEGMLKPELRAPYHLINAALNIQGSDYANRRGRNADFFLFSPKYVGSEATGYADTEALEEKAKGLDLATAMAISGAAASSNMGSSSIRPLTATLALLNVRLGYWLRHPRYADDLKSSALYLWSEISGRLYENSAAVYLTDGGHIENLGVYELLRRRCRVVIAVDAEADPSMNFGSLITLQRYARIDLGIRINLPWSPIRKATRDWMSANAGKPPPIPPRASDGPHVAIGTIDYGGGQTGYLVYIKSSLTGDESDYICDYARRYDRFPHETTGDQFFSEEQFEVYRALGFHMTHGFLDDKHKVSALTDRGVPRLMLFSDTGSAVLAEVRKALGK